MLKIRQLQKQDIGPIAAAFEALGWNKPASQYERYLAEQDHAQRMVLVALNEEVFAGYVTIVWVSNYPPFRVENIPEIVDFNVRPQFRRRGIGSRLMDEAECIVAQRSGRVGIGVGLYSDYGSAQRMYVKRGYVPDGRGLFYRGHFVGYGEAIIADDDLTIYFTKEV